MSSRKIAFVTPTPPAGTTFAAVQVEATADGKTWRVVGAETCRRIIRDDEGRYVDDVLKDEVNVTVRALDDDVQLRCVWVCEDKSVPPVTTTHDPSAPAGRRRRLGGPR